LNNIGDQKRYNHSQQETIMMLKDKAALVTGGTSGIGRATATLAVSAKQRAFGAAGAKVLFSGRRETKSEETAAMIGF
jgi:NAD(P)-dependent dehydrogenase (short-subunit alcohol dehydrogenase family)